MENTEIINKYEMVVILDSKLNGEQKDEILKEVAETVTKGGCKVINSQVWLEKHKFAFEIKKISEGTYYIFNLEGTGDQVQKITPALKIKENVLRFAIHEAEAQ